MRAVVLQSYGEPDVLQVTEVPDPVPGPEEVLVDVVATAINRADLLQRRGMYPSPPLGGFGLEAPEIPGMEFSGRVAEVGARVTELAVGDEVMGIVGGGGYAEKLVIHERQAMRIPSSVPVADAAAIPEVWITAYDALVLQGGLTAGRTALVHAGGSGVGTAAIQICTAIGAKVITTASTGKVEALRQLGADLVVDYTSEDFVAACDEFTGGRGVDVVLDVIGGDYVDRNVKALRVGGTIVLVGVMGGFKTPVAVGALLPKRATLIGTTLRIRPLEEKIAVSRTVAAEVLPLFDAGRARPVIDSRFPLDEIAAAHGRMEANANLGKILVDVQP
jgi:NADPH2:quinone reductase